MISIDRIPISISTPTGKRIVEASLDLEGGVFATVEGEIIPECYLPTAGTSYVGMTKTRTRFAGEG